MVASPGLKPAFEGIPPPPCRTPHPDERPSSPLTNLNREDPQAGSSTIVDSRAKTREDEAADIRAQTQDLPEKFDLEELQAITRRALANVELPPGIGRPRRPKPSF